MKLKQLLETSYNYYNCCVSWDNDDVEDGLIDMIDNSEEIDREEFVRNIGQENYNDIEEQLGYDYFSMKMEDDHYVEYFKSTLHGYQVYYLKHSAIEYVFVPSDFHSP